MKTTVIETAPAKINLTLDIISKRPDGYHNIDSIMQSVSLFDRIELTYDSEANGISLICNIPGLTCGNDNLCYRAARTYLDASGIGGGVAIQLEKRIPIAAGLGGGSSDAAAVLRALNKISPQPMKLELLISLAASLGADVPFCLAGGCMRARGIGELLLPFPSLPNCEIVIARDGNGISAGEAYRLFDLAPIYTDVSNRIAASNSNIKKMIPLFSNAFEQAVFSVRPRANQLCKKLTSLGALCSHMSGSGDAIYGIFLENKAALSAINVLKTSGVFAELCYPVAINTDN